MDGMATRKEELESVDDFARGLRRLDNDRARIRCLSMAWAIIQDAAAAKVTVEIAQGSGVTYGSNP